MSRGPRTRIGTGIYRDRSGISAVVTVRGRQKELRFPPETSIGTIRKRMDAQRRKMRERRRANTPKAGTLAADAERYLAEAAHLAGQSSVRSEVKVWTDLYGHLNRDAIGASHMRRAIGAWTEAGVAPKTIRNRLARLERIYRVLDSRDADTPCDDLSRAELPKPTKRPIIRVPDTVIADVAATLEMSERIGWLRDAKTRARFLVLVATGRRPSEIRAAQPTDVNLSARVWIPRDAKGGDTPGGLWLNDDALAAWTLFAKAKAWGYYRTSSFDRTIHRAGWPANIPPYMARHTYGISLSEAGVDLADVQPLMGHKHISTTRRHYVPVIHSRLQEAVKRVDGRLGLERPLGTEENIE